VLRDIAIFAHVLQGDSVATLGDDLTKMSRILTKDIKTGDTNLVDTIRATVVESARQLSAKAPIYGTLVGLLNLKVPSFGAQVAAHTVQVLERALIPVPVCPASPVSVSCWSFVYHSLADYSSNLNALYAMQVRGHKALQFRDARAALRFLAELVNSDVVDAASFVALLENVLAVARDTACGF
jgi:MIF4G domain-containing protein